MIRSRQVSFLSLSQYIRFHQALVRRPCRIIDLMRLSSVPGLGQELHGRLKEVYVQPHVVIQSFQTLMSGSGSISIVAHQTAYHIPILLLHMAAIVFLVGTRPGEGNLLLVTVGVEALVDEFAAVIRVHAKQGKGKTLPHPVYGRLHPLLAFPPDRQAFRPAAGNVYRTERVQIETLRTLTAVSYQVCLHEARLVLLPVGKGPDGYRALKQASRLSSGKRLTASQLSARPQQTVDGGRAYPAELCLHRRTEPLLAVLPEYLYHLRKERL